MRSVICLTIFVFALCEANPVKRFAGFNVAGIGGSAGCVVTGNKLFANGFFLRELTADEQRELAQYEESVKRYKEEVKTTLEARRQQLQNRRGKTVKSVAPSAQTEQPKAPEKPSFCSAGDTTQYYFDGCMVQNNKVYVGREYARSLSEDEIRELKEFDAKMSVYQKYLTSTIQEQVKGLFGSNNNFWQGILGEETVSSTAAAVAPTTPITPVEAPNTPNFCTAIY